MTDRENYHTWFLKNNLWAPVIILIVYWGWYSRALLTGEAMYVYIGNYFQLIPYSTSTIFFRKPEKFEAKSFLSFITGLP
jgi:hypothetical protein